MRKHLFISAALALAAGLGLVSFGAQATPIPVNLSGCAGQTTCTDNGVTFTGWEYTSSGWQAAPLTYKNDPHGESGLGVECSFASGPKCIQGDGTQGPGNQLEINATPWQMIGVNIGSLKLSSLLLGVGSVDSQGGKGNPETAFLLAGLCTSPACVIAEVNYYVGSNADNTSLFTFSPEGLSNFFLTPRLFANSNPAPDANILLASLAYNVTVPEPAELGMFGLGVLLIGLFAGLLRRMR
ncbi:MAG: hypothetical protein ACRESE_04870 [Gammaproteobacteria bacterium]